MAALISARWFAYRADSPSGIPASSGPVPQAPQTDTGHSESNHSPDAVSSLPADKSVVFRRKAGNLYCQKRFPFAPGDIENSHCRFPP